MGSPTLYPEGARDELNGFAATILEEARVEVWRESCGCCGGARVLRRVDSFLLTFRVS